MPPKRKTRSRTGSEEPASTNIPLTRSSRRNQGLKPEITKEEAEESLGSRGRRSVSVGSNAPASGNTSAGEEPPTPRRSRRTPKRKASLSPAPSTRPKRKKAVTKKAEQAPALETVTEVPTPVQEEPKTRSGFTQSALEQVEIDSPITVTHPKATAEELQPVGETTHSPSNDSRLPEQDMAAINTIEPYESTNYFAGEFEAVSQASPTPDEHANDLLGAEDIAQAESAPRASLSEHEDMVKYSESSSDAPASLEPDLIEEQQQPSLSSPSGEQVEENMNTSSEDDTDTSDADEIVYGANIAIDNDEHNSGSADESSINEESFASPGDESDHVSAEAGASNVYHTEHGTDDNAAATSDDPTAAQSKGIFNFVESARRFISGPFRTEPPTRTENPVGTEHPDILDAASTTSNGEADSEADPLIENATQDAAPSTDNATKQSISDIPIGKEPHDSTSASPDVSKDLKSACTTLPKISIKEMALKDWDEMSSPHSSISEDLFPQDMGSEPEIKISQSLQFGWQTMDNVTQFGYFRGRNAVPMRGVDYYEPDLILLEQRYPGSLNLPPTGPDRMEPTVDPIDLRNRNHHIFLDETPLADIPPDSIRDDPELLNFLRVIWRVMADKDQGLVGIHQTHQLMNKNAKFKSQKSEHTQQVATLRDQLRTAQLKISDLQSNAYATEHATRMQLETAEKTNRLWQKDRDHYQQIATKLAKERMAAEAELKKRKDPPETETGPTLKVIRTGKGTRRLVGENSEDYSALNTMMDGIPVDRSDLESPETAARKKKELERRRRMRGIQTRMHQQAAEDEQIRKIIQPPSGDPFVMSGALVANTSSDDEILTYPLSVSNVEADQTHDDVRPEQQPETPNRRWRFANLFTPIQTWFGRGPQEGPQTAPHPRPIAQPVRRRTSDTSSRNQEASIPDVGNTMGTLMQGVDNHQAIAQVNSPTPGATNYQATEGRPPFSAPSTERRPLFLPKEALAPPPNNSATSTPRPPLRSIRRQRQIRAEAEAQAQAERTGTGSLNNTPSKVGDKRKRTYADEPKSIPNPVGSSYGMDLAYFELSSDEEEEHPSTAKKRKPSSSNRKRVSDVIGDNVFDSYDEQIAAAIQYGKKFGVWTGPRRTESSHPVIAKTSGYFAVPDDSDSESDYSQEESSQLSSKIKRAPGQGSKLSPARNGTDPKLQRQHEKNEAENVEQNLDTEALSEDDLSNDALNPHSLDTSGEALARARSQAEKYKPKTPSGLRTTSRLSSSPAIDTLSKLNHNAPAPQIDQGPKNVPSEAHLSDNFEYQFDWPVLAPVADDNWPSRNSQFESHFYNEFVHVAHQINASV